jgi:hypothetical protein
MKGLTDAGGEPAHIAFQFGQLLAGTQLQRAFERDFVVDGAARFHLPGHFVVSEIEKRHQGRGAKLLARHHNRLQAVRLPKGAYESGIRMPRAPERAPLGENDGPREDGKDQ